MVNVKTRDWGDKYKALSEHIGKVSAAVVKHNEALKAEAGSHQHAFGRHGWQTGWESQIVRAAAGVTPDSADDPYGLNPALRNWGHVFVAGPGGFSAQQYGRGALGQRVLTGSGEEHLPLPSHEPPARGCSAGQFISPVAQQTAIQASRLKITQKYGKWVEGQRRRSGRTNFHPVKRVVIVTRTNEILGLGFEASRAGTPRSEVETKFLVDAFQNSVTVRDVVNRCPFASQATRDATIAALMVTHKIGDRQALSLHNDEKAFPQIMDLCSCLDVAIQTNRNVLSVWDWKDDKWQLVTCYATDDAREECEYTIEGTSRANGQVTGTLKGGTATTSGTIHEGKVRLS